MKKVFVAAAMAFLTMGVQAQNLVKDGNFDTPLNNEKTYASIPSTEDWFVLDKTNGATTISPATDDEKHGNAVQIENTTDNSWYKAYLGQRIKGAEKAVYTLSFDMKALTDNAQVRCFIRDAKTENLFIMREGFNISDESTKNQSAAAFSRIIKKAGRWSKVSATFDFSKTVNAFASIKGVEAKGGTVTEAPVSDSTLGDFVIVIQLQTKDSKALIDNVSLTKK